MTEDAKWLYDKLSSRGYNLGSESEFEQTLTSDDNIEWYYRKGTNVGLKLGTYDEFKTSLFPASTTEPIVTSETPDVNKDERNHYQTLIGSDTSFAENYIKEQEEKKKAQAKVQENYLNSGLSEQDKAQRDEYNKLMGEQAMNQMAKTFGLEQPVLNEYGMPTSAETEPMYKEQKTTIPLKTQEQQVEEQIQNMPEYITRGEDDLYKIKANSIERALNTSEGKELFSQLFNEASFLFKNSGDGLSLLDKYNKGEISEEEVEKAFQDKYLQDIYSEFFDAVTKKGGVMHDYFSVAYRELGKYSAKKGTNSIDRALQEYDRVKELAFNDEVRERYKSKYGMYPEEDKAFRLDEKDNVGFRWRRLKDIEGEIKQEEQIGYKTSEITGETKQYRKDMPKIIQLEGAKEFNEEAKNLIDAVEVQKQKIGGGFAKAFGRTVSDVDTWDMGFSNLMRSGALLEVLKKVDANAKLPDGERVSTDKLLTKEEKLLMDSALNYFAVSAFYSDSLGRGYKAGTTSAASIPFMLQFVLSAGSLSALEASVNAAAKEGGEWLIGTLAKYGTEKMAKVAASEGFKAVGKASAGIVSSIIGAGALTASWDIPSIAAGSFERQIGQMKPVFGEDGKSFVYGGRTNAQGAGEATWNAFADKYIERLSEMVLAKAFDPIKAWGMTTNAFKSIAKSDLVSTMIEIGRHPVTKAIKEKAMFGGLLEEMLEEELGGLLRLATNTDVNSLKEAGLDMDGQIDIFLGLAPTSLLFSGVGAASYYGKLAINSKKLRDSLVSESERNMFDKLMSESRSGKFGDLAHELIRDVILTDKTKTGRKITNEQKRDLLIGILNKYQDVLSNELQEQTKTVIKEENDAAIDNIVKNGSYGKTGNIYVTTAENGKRYVIVGGNVEFDEIDVAGEKQRSVDISNSDAQVQVREVLGKGKLGNVEKIRTASLTGEVNATSAEEYKKFNQAMNKAEQEEKEIFEYGDNIYETATSKKLGTKEEYEKRKKQEEELAKKDSKPTINTEPRKINESFNLVVDGKNKKVTFYNADFVQNEDGSINTDESGMFIVEVGGEKISRSQQEDYINALSEHLKSEHAKAIEEYDRKQLEQGQADNTPEQPKIISDEDRAARDAELARKAEEQAKETKRQEILASAEKKDATKFTAEEDVVVMSQELGNEIAIKKLRSKVISLREQIQEINNKKMDEVDKWKATRKLSQQLAAYESAVKEWLGEDALAEINAPVEAPVETPTPAAPLTEPVAEVADAEVKVPEPEVPAIEEQPQVVEDSEVAAEMEDEVQEDIVEEEPQHEPIDLNDENIVFVKQGKDRVKVARRNEDGTLTFVDNGKKVSDKWQEMSNKFLVYYNGQPSYILTTANSLDELPPQGVNIASADYSGNRVKVSKFDLTDENGKPLFLTGAQKQEKRVGETYKSVDDFLNAIIYVDVKGGKKLTLKELLGLKAYDANRGKRGARSLVFQVERYVRGLENESEARSIIKKHLQELISDWNVYVRMNNLTDVVTEDEMTDFYSDMKEQGGYTSNGLIVQAQDFNKLNSASITDNPLLQLTVMLDQASQLGLTDENIDMYAVDKFSTIKGKEIAIADMTDDELERAIKEIELDRAKKEDNSIYIKRYNALQKEQKRRTKAVEPSTATQEKKEEPADIAPVVEQKPAKKAATNVNDLYSAILELSIRANDMSSSALSRTVGKEALKSRIDNLSEEEARALYIKMEKERSATQGQAREDITNAIAALENSKYADVVKEEQERIMALLEQMSVPAMEEVAQGVEEESAPEIDYEALVAERNDLQEAIYDMSNEEAAYANARINEINDMLRSRAEFMVDEQVQESAKAAKVIINLLKKAGIRVVEVTEQQIEQMVGSDEYKKLTADGVVYGAAHKGMIYLNSEHLNPNTPLHEFTHLWVDWYKNEFKEEWERFVKLAVKSKVAKQLKTKKAYKKLNDSDLASEVLSRYTGYTYGAMTEEEKSEFENLMRETGSIEEQIAEKPLLKAIREFWKNVISIFDKTVLEVKEEEAIDDMIRRFSKLPMLTLIRGKEAVDEMKEMAKKGTMVVYHGTAAEFSQFDHDFMGTGEGAQAYGWGTYVSQVKDIAVNYAKADAGRKQNPRDYNPFKDTDKWRLFHTYSYQKIQGNFGSLEEFIEDAIDTAASILLRVVIDYNISFTGLHANSSYYASAKQIRDDMKRIIEKANKEDIGDIYDRFDTIEKFLDFPDTYDSLSNDEKQEIEIRIKKLADAIKAKRNLYTVEIPAESYTEDGKIDIENSPYLGWDDYADNFELLDKVRNSIKEFIENIYGVSWDALLDKSKGHIDAMATLIRDFGMRISEAQICGHVLKNSIVQGKMLYEAVKVLTGSPKAASQWLLSQGIVGIRVSTNATSGKKRNTKNYVIFNEADAHIVDHIKFMTGKSAEKETNFDKKFKKMQETLDKGGVNVLSLQQISELTDTLEDDLRQGNRPLVFERLPQGALQTLLKEQRLLREALLVAALRSRRATQKDNIDEDGLSLYGSNRQMEFDLRHYAKEKGLWHETPVADMESQYGESLGYGHESIGVWDDGNGYVVKVKDTGQYGTLEEFLEAIVLNNWMFPENKQEITGFGYLLGENGYGEDKNGYFSVILKTPLINFSHTHTLSQEEKDNFMSQYGFSPVYSEGREDTKLYSNGDYLVKDLHDGNIVRSNDGEIYVIDAIIKRAEGERYRQSTPEELERDEQNEEKLDAWVNDRIQFMIGPAASTSAPVDPTLLLDEKAAKALEVKSKKYAAKLANPKVDLPEEIGGMFVAKNFDRTEGIRRIMESIAEFRKSHGLPKMGEGFDVRTLVETKDSKINNQIKSFDNNQVKRLEKIVNKWAKRINKSDIYKKYKNEQLRNQEGEVTTLTPIEFLERYLIACDSIERQVLTKNPRGVGGFLQRMGITVKDFHDEFVKELVNDKQGKDMREELWEAVRGVTRVTLEVGRESGLISQDEYDKDIKRQFYVPERDFAEVEANKELWIEGAEWSKRKRGKKLRAMQKAKKEGGLTLAANVLSNMLDLTYDAIAKAEENKVKVAMFDLLSANEAWCNQNKVPVPIRVWYEIGADGKPVRRTTEPSRTEREEMKKYKGEVRKLESLILNEEDRKTIYEGKIDELNEKLNSGVSGTEKADIENDIAELKTLILQSNDKIQEWKDDIDVYKAMYPYMDTIDVRNIMFESREQQKRETVIAYIDGVPCEMHFTNMEIVADCLNNVRYDDWYFDDIKKVTSYASAIFTVYNPTFFTVNLARDIPYILSKGYAEYGWQFPVRFAAKLIAETFSSTIWKAVAGKDYSDSLYSEHFNEFFEGGGNTGYTQLPEMQRIKKQVKDWEKKRMITWGDVGNVMSFMNEWSEVLTRSAAYSVVRDMGYNQEEGIRAAKNLSVNFNRKGLGSKFMNLFSSFSMFANAVVQGACGFYRTFNGHEDTKVERIMHVTRAIMSIGLAPAFSGFITTLLQPDDGDEYLVSDWERDNYMIFGDVRIPLSEQLKPFWCIGVNIALGMQGKRDGKAIARSLINSFFVNLVPAPNSFNSTLQMLTDAILGYRDFSGAALADNLFTPQVLKSTNSIANNTNFMGGKFRYDIKDIPEFTMGENEPYIYRAIAELAYNLRGGDSAIKSTSIRVVNEYGEVDYVPMSKAWNVNPKQIEAWANVFVPSGIRDIANAAAVAVGTFAGDEDAKFNSKEYNFITRFYKPQDKEMNQYFLLKDIKKEVDYYNTAKSTAMKNILGSDIVGNQEWEERATQMYEELSENTLMVIEASLIKQYDKLHMDKISKKYALTKEQMEQGIGKEEVEEIDRERDNILRKILILDMERKGNELYTYDDFVKQKKYSEQEKEDILEEIYSELRARRPIE